MGSKRKRVVNKEPIRNAFTKALSASSKSFSLNLFQKCLETSRGANVFVSPLSVALALALAAKGAREGSIVAGAFDNVIQCGPSADDAFALLEDMKDGNGGVILGNSIWVKRIREEYMAALANVGVVCGNLDNVDKINAWARTVTRGVIDCVVHGPVGAETTAMLVNVVYFKASWAKVFQSDRTHASTFNGSVPCRMMCKTEKVSFVRNETYSAVSIKYATAGYRAVFVLPNKHGHEALNALLSRDSFSNVVKALKTKEKQEVDISMPRFKIETSLEMTGSLSSLGLGVAFDKNVAPESFTPIGEDVYIGNVVQKVVVIVNEEGTEAAAMTALHFYKRGKQPPPKPCIVLDRSFGMMIEDTRRNLVLFAGSVVSPTFD